MSKILTFFKNLLTGAMALVVGFFIVLLLVAFQIGGVVLGLVSIGCLIAFIIFACIKDYFDKDKGSEL